jgi:hypothetical protein
MASRIAGKNSTRIVTVTFFDGSGWVFRDQYDGLVTMQSFDHNGTVLGQPGIIARDSYKHYIMSATIDRSALGDTTLTTKLVWE